MRLWRVFIFSGYLFYLLAGIRQSLSGRPEVVDAWISLALGVVVVGFCVVDCRVRGGVFLRSFQWLMFFTWPFGLPVYLLWSRGIGRGLLAVLLGLLGLAATAVIGSGITMAVWLAAGTPGRG